MQHDIPIEKPLHLVPDDPSLHPMKLVEYHQPAFCALISENRRFICENLHYGCREFRSRTLKEILVAWMEYKDDDGWERFRTYIDLIEKEIASILTAHSRLYWNHLTRRIPVIYPDVPSRDFPPGTKIHVREIFYLAINKLSNTSMSDDIGSADQMMPEAVLGGHFLPHFQTNLALWSGNFASIWKQIVENKTVVLRKFSVQDMVWAFRAMGLCYEYWIATAHLRALGRGSAIVWNGGTECYRQMSPTINKLIHDYDRRSSETPSMTGVVGVWLTSQQDVGSPSMFVPLYNHADEDGSTYLRSFGVRPADDTPFVPNFLIGWLDIQRFHQAHEFLAEPFKRRYGYGFWEFLVTLYGLGLIILLSPRLGMLSRDPFQGYFEPYGQGLRLFINALRRGQEFVAMSGDHLADMVWQRIRGLPDSRATTVDDIRKCLGDLTLTPDKHHQIRLWSGGRQFPVIPFDGGYLIDGQGLVSLLRTMFVDVQFDQGPRGPVFERAFRLALAEAGFPAEKSGRIRTHSGEMREIDASVRIGGELILFECRAMARPLLYDLGKPSVLRKRTEDLANKVKQVASLRDFIRRNPRGRNYNFEWAQAISTFVVSPFVEWLWDTSSELWHDGTMPRILQADAALSYLRQRRGEQKVSQPDNA